MSLYVIIAPQDNQQIGGSIASAYPNAALELWPGDAKTWVVSAAEGTAKEVAERLRVAGGQNGRVIVFAVSGYYGYASTSYWEWIKARWSNP